MKEVDLNNRGGLLVFNFNGRTLVVVGRVLGVSKGDGGNSGTQLLYRGEFRGESKILSNALGESASDRELLRLSYDDSKKFFKKNFQFRKKKLPEEKEKESPSKESSFHTVPLNVLL